MNHAQRTATDRGLVIPVICRILSACRRHPPVVLLAVLGLVSVSAFGATRLTFDTDVLSLLPRGGRVIPAFRTFSERFGSLDELYVVLSAPEGFAISDYEAEVDAWIGHVRGIDGVARVDTGIADQSRDLDWLADRQLLLMPAPALDAALRRLDGDAAREALASRRELLALPSTAASDAVRHDPLGFYDLLRDHLGGPSGVHLGVTPGGYVSPDSRSRLLIVHPARPPYDTDFSRALIRALEQIPAAVAAAVTRDQDTPPLAVEFAGGHRIATETESLVRRESILNSVLSLALILPLLFAVFRSVWLVCVGPVPAAISLVIVLGLLGITGATLSAAATASAALLFGLGIDGVVLLYVAHTSAFHDAAVTGGSISHLRGPATSMLLGMWTTAATFYGLAAVDFPSLEQLGMLIGHSMVLCGILTLVLIPALLPRRSGSANARSLSMPGLARAVRTHRSTIMLVTAIVTIAFGVAALRVRINPTLDRLRSVTPGAAAFERMSQLFGLQHDVYVILQRGADLESLLGANERMSDAAARAMPPVPLRAAAAVLPSAATQLQRAERVSATGLSAPAVAAALDRAGQAEGFKPDSFSPFLRRLPVLLSAQHRVTYEGFVEHGLSDVIGRFVQRDERGWLLASYAFPSSGAEIERLLRLVSDSDATAVLTGLPLVNQELAARFLPQFLKGLAIGTCFVLVLLIGTFRDWRYSMLSLAPAIIGLIWAAGVLALARIELDLFAVFAVVTFVGIGVDYGIHLVHRYRDCRDAERATAHLAPVILVAAAITLIGYGTLVTSSYPPLQSIGLVSVIAVLTLTVASVVVLPALLPHGSRAAGTDDPGAQRS